MHFQKLDNESEILGYPVCKLENWESESNIESAILNLQKSYLYVEVQSDDISSIQMFNALGFSLSEFRVYMQLDLDYFDNYSRAFYPYTVSLITEEDDLHEVLDILKSYPSDDRFSNDPVIPDSFSEKRNKANLIKSFSNYPNEWLLGMFNQLTKELSGFTSLGIFDDSTAYIFQQGISSVIDHHLQAIDMLDSLVLSYLKENGIKWVKSVSTGFNILEINRRIRNNGFEVTSSSVILRKITG